MVCRVIYVCSGSTFISFQRNKNIRLFYKYLFTSGLDKIILYSFQYAIALITRTIWLYLNRFALKMLRACNKCIVFQ